MMCAKPFGVLKKEKKSLYFMEFKKMYEQNVHLLFSIDIKK